MLVLVIACGLVLALFPLHVRHLGVQHVAPAALERVYWLALNTPAQIAQLRPEDVARTRWLVKRDGILVGIGGALVTLFAALALELAVAGTIHVLYGIPAALWLTDLWLQCAVAFSLGLAIVTGVQLTSAFRFLYARAVRFIVEPEFSMANKPSARRLAKRLFARWVSGGRPELQAAFAKFLEAHNEDYQQAMRQARFIAVASARE